MTTTDVEDPTSSRPLVTQTLITYASTLSPKQKPIATSLLLPTLLKRASGELQALDKEAEQENEQLKQQIFTEASARLLELAAIDQAAFRGVVGSLNPEQRSFMESVVQAGRNARSVEVKSDEESREPTIALRMNFGS